MVLLHDEAVEITENTKMTLDEMIFTRLAKMLVDLTVRPSPSN